MSERLVAINDLPQSVMIDVMNYALDNPGPVRDAIKIGARVSLTNALEAYLQWNGIFGFTAQILSIVKASQSVEDILSITKPVKPGDEYYIAANGRRVHKGPEELK